MTHGTTTFSDRTRPIGGEDRPLFAASGAHVIVDGQFGSTGKGAFASWLAAEACEQGWRPDLVVSNAGPNSGHTFVHEGERHVLKQLPTFAVALYLRGIDVPVHLSAGAAIDPAILRDEMARYPGLVVSIHPNAVLIDPLDLKTEAGGTIAAVAGTGSGTGAAISRKVLRAPDAVVGSVDSLPGCNVSVEAVTAWNGMRVVLEVSQGFSLGINSSFYPKTTSRECTVMQAMSDARMPPRFLARTFMTIRTFPIRVGNHNGNGSGGCYADQRELSWSEVGVRPEITTVTKRERRVFSFSDIQFREAVAANDPDFVFVNFLNYLTVAEQEAFVTRLRGDGFSLIGGFGPTIEDIRRL